MGDTHSVANPRNFWPKDIEDFFSYRIGIPKIWQKLSRENQFQGDVGASNEAVAEQKGRQQLQNILQRRNDIIHRGFSYYTPSESEVRNGSNFLKTFITNVTAIMHNNLVSL